MVIIVMFLQTKDLYTYLCVFTIYANVVVLTMQLLSDLIAKAQLGQRDQGSSLGTSYSYSW